MSYTNTIKSKSSVHHSRFNIDIPLDIIPYFLMKMSLQSIKIKSLKEFKI